MLKNLFCGMVALSIIALPSCDQFRVGTFELERELILQFNNFEAEKQDLMSAGQTRTDALVNSPLSLERSSAALAATRESIRKQIQIAKRQKNILQQLCDINPEAQVGIDFQVSAKNKLSGMDEYIASLESIGRF